MLLSARIDQLRPHTAHDPEVARIGGRFPELAPKPREMHVDRSIFAPERLVPNLGEKLALGDDRATPGREILQQVELLASKRELPAGEEGAMKSRVDLELANQNRTVLLVGSGASDDGTDPRVKL